MMRDPYQVLGVSRTASEAEIKKAYRRLAKAHHPDQNQGDSKAASRFSEVNQAYEIVGDQTKRAQFDRGEIDGDGKPRFAGMGAGPGGGRQNANHFEFEFGPGGPAGRGGRRGGPGFDPSELFADLFGSMRGGGGAAGFYPQNAPKGNDAALKLRISLAEAVLGGKKRIEVPSGKSLDVTIPPGTVEGQTIRLKGQGFATPHGENGDLLLTLSIDQHPLFHIDGHDLRLDLPVSLDEAVLGAKVRVPTLDGAVDVTIAPGSNSGRILRLRGKGAGKPGTRGDLFVKLLVILPEDDSGLLRLAEELREKRPYRVRRPDFGA